MFQRTEVPLSSVLDAEDKGTVILQNVRNYSPNNTSSHPTRLGSSSLKIIQQQIKSTVAWNKIVS
jgi:hypothetical protein